MLSFLRLFATSWTVAHQVPLSMGFLRQEYWIRLPFPSPGDLPHPGIKAMSSVSPALVGGFFSTEPPGKPKELEHQLNLSLKGRKLFHVVFTWTPTLLHGQIASVREEPWRKMRSGKGGAADSNHSAASCFCHPVFRDASVVKYHFLLLDKKTSRT